MASMKPSQHLCSFRSTLLTRPISPGHRKHKQHLRFQQLQQTKRRAVKFWSLLGFCAKSNFILWRWVCVDYCYYHIPHKSPNTWIWAIIYCLILLFHLSQLHFSLSPNPRKEIIIFPETLKYLWVRENTDFTTTILKPRTCEVLYEFKVCSIEKSQIELKLEMASVGKMWENTHADMLHILHPQAYQFHTILIHSHLGKGNKLRFTASCGPCLILWHLCGGQTFSLVSYQVSVLPDPKKTSIKENYWFFLCCQSIRTRLQHTGRSSCPCPAPS